MLIFCYTGMSKQSERVKKWRRETKSRIIEAMGGACACCAYNKCNSALALHHLNPNEKDFGLGAIRANIKSWKTIVKEIKKCILLCHNCHSEVHDGIREIPENYPTFNPLYEDYSSLIKDSKKIKESKESIKNKKQKSYCPSCNKEFCSENKYCSNACYFKSKSKIDWDSINLLEEIKTKSLLKIAKELGCSDNAVRKRLKKITST